MANLSNINNKFLVTTGGNVGIGNTSPTLSTLAVGIGSTNNPSQICQLAGSGSGVYSVLSLTNTNGVAADNNGVGLDFHVNAAYSATGRIQIIHPTAQSGTATNSSMQFLTYGTVSGVTTFSPRMTIDYIGNVGIGTDSPDMKIDVEDNSTTWAGRILNTNSNGQGLLVRSDSTTASNLVLAAYGDGGYKMVVRSDGNVGIGTNTPAAKLTIGDPGGNTTRSIQIEGNNSTSGMNGVIGYFANGLYISNNYYYSSGQVHPVSTFGQTNIACVTGTTAGSNYITFNVSDHTDPNNAPDSRMIILDSGNVGIGGTLANKRLYVLGDTTNYQILAEQPSGYAGLSIKSTTVAQTWSWIANDNGSNSDLLLYGGSSAGTKLTIDSSGTTTITNGTNDNTLLLLNGARGRRLRVEEHNTGNGGIAITSQDDNETGTTNSNNRTILLNANGGNVGIGTDSPAEKLSVVGGNIRLESTIAGNNGILIIYDSNTTQSGQIYGSAGDLKIYSPADVLFNQGGNVGIGTSAPDQTGYGYKTLTIIGGTNHGDSGVIELLSPSVSAEDQNMGIVSFGAGSTRTAMISANRQNANNASSLRFWTSAGSGILERMRIETDGTVRVKTGSVLVETSGQGIFLGGTAATNRLDYYEEGNWTPTIAHNNGTGAVPLTVNHARYIRVGQLVYISAYLTGINPNGNAGGSGPYYGVRNFPFQPENYGAWQIVYASSGITAYGGYSSSASLYFMANGTNGQRSTSHVSGAGVNAWGSNLTFMFNCVYNIHG